MPRPPVRRLARPVRFARRSSIAVLLAGLLAPAAVARAIPPRDADPNTRAGLLSLATENSGVAPDDTITRLRAAVARDPHDVEYWAALVNMFAIRGKADEADLCARAALRANPDDATLLLAWAKVLRRGPALDVLRELARRPGHEAEAARLSEVVSLDMFVPQPGDWGRATVYQKWAERLIYLDRVDRAVEVLDEGIGKLAALKAGAGKGDGAPAEYDTDPTPLTALKAIALALQGKFPEAMALQKACDFRQQDVPGKYRGLGDVLLLKGKPALAVDSFGDAAADAAPGEAGRPRKADGGRLDGESRRVLAFALLQTGAADRAERVLAGDADVRGRLLRLRLYMAAGRKAHARLFGDELADPLHTMEGSYGGPYLPQPDSAASLEPEYWSAVALLIELHPEKARHIKMFIGSPDAAAKAERRSEPFNTHVVPAFQYIARTDAELADVDARAKAFAAKAGPEWQSALGKAVADARQQSGDAYAEAHRYAEAARAVAPLAVDPAGRNAARQWAAADVVWSRYRRRADAYAALEKDPAAVLAAYDDARKLDAAVGHGDAGPARDAMVRRLIDAGPAALAAVYEGLGINTISGQDRSPFVNVIAAVGGPEDVPPLVDVLSLIVSEGEKGRRHPAPSQDEADLASERAIHACLEKLTGQKNSETGRAERVQFWVRWWEANAEKVVASKSGRGS